MFWADKHQPKSLDDFLVHKDISQILLKLSKSQNLPHLLFYGPPGSGKNSLIKALLTAIFGEGAAKTKIESKELKINSKTVEFSIISSIFHLEITPSAAGLSDGKIIQQTLKEIASTSNFDSPRNFKVVVIREAARLSSAAQHSLRRTMERFSRSCRIFLCCSDLNRIIDPLQSRCLPLRVGAASERGIVDVLNFVCLKENILANEKFFQRIAKESKGNLRRAILTLETCHSQQYPFKENQKIEEIGWEIFLGEVAKLIFQEQSAKHLLAVRLRIYELINHLIPPTVIFTELTNCLIEQCNNEKLELEIIHWAAFHEHRMNNGSKEIYHIEAFVAKVMQIYQSKKR